MRSLPIINILHQSGMFVTTDEATLTHHHPPKFMVYITVYHGAVHSVCLGKCIMTCIHYYGGSKKKGKH